MPGSPGMGLSHELRRERAGGRSARGKPRTYGTDAQSSASIGTSYQRACGKHACIHWRI